MQVFKQPIRTILLIDDDKDDCDLFKEALHEVAPSIQLISLTTTGAIPATVVAIKPDLIFLDINMPRINGFDCLKMLHESVTQFRMPIVMYSNSGNPKEINIAYALGATLYLQKPSGYSKLIESIRGILNLSWDEPAEIKQQYFRSGKYSSFQLI
ncbi:MAG TPA: response regulator [Flavisolibacter sp.]|nr:response regulator [Flavisolibacter sp.]